MRGRVAKEFNRINQGKGNRRLILDARRAPAVNGAGAAEAATVARRPDESRQAFRARLRAIVHPPSRGNPSWRLFPAGFDADGKPTTRNVQVGADHSEADLQLARYNRRRARLNVGMPGLDWNTIIAEAHAPKKPAPFAIVKGG